MSKRLIEISNSSHPAIRFLKYYSEKLNLGWDFESTRDWIPQNIKSADLVLLDLALSPQILPEVSLVPAQVKTFGCFDSVVLENEHAMPRNIFFQALESFFIEFAKDLDIRSAAFVVGDGVEARVVALFLASRGIRSINLVGNVKKLKQEITILARAQIGIEFKAVAPEDMTLQSTSAGVLVNTMDLSQNSELMTDLSYFNYMKRDAYILDLCPVKKDENILLEEAERAGFRILKDSDFLGVFVRDCLKRIGCEHKPLIWESYQKENYS